jgi:hypothetical protein
MLSGNEINAHDYEIAVEGVCRLGTGGFCVSHLRAVPEIGVHLAGSHLRIYLQTGAALCPGYLIVWKVLTFSSTIRGFGGYLSATLRKAGIGGDTRARVGQISLLGGFSAGTAAAITRIIA